MTPTNSTQPGSVPYADFELTQESTKMRKDQIGPYGDGTEIPIFVQQPLEVHFYKFFCPKKSKKNWKFRILIHCSFERVILVPVLERFNPSRARHCRLLPLTISRAHPEWGWNPDDWF